MRTLVINVNSLGVHRVSCAQVVIIVNSLGVHRVLCAHVIIRVNSLAVHRSSCAHVVMLVNSLAVHRLSCTHVIKIVHSLAADDTFDVEPKPPDAQVVLADAVFLERVELLSPITKHKTSNSRQVIGQRWVSTSINLVQYYIRLIQ